MTLFFVLWTLFAIWWIIWIIVALSRKAYTMFTFLLLSGLAWTGLCFAAANYLGGYAALGLLVIPLIILPPMVCIITEFQRGVLYRLGRMKTILEPGFNLVFPLRIDVVRKVDIRTFTIDVPKQEVITRDNVPVLVDAVVYFNVFNPELAVNKVADYAMSTSLLSQTVLRSILGQHELDEMLSKRAELGELIQKLLDEATDPWGIKVSAVEIKAVELAESIKRAMAKQAEAERERRAKIIAAEGELQASEKLTQAATIIATQPAALQLRYLQTLSEVSVEKNSTIVFPLPIELLRVFDAKSKS